jgi:hypothetical protein
MYPQQIGDYLHSKPINLDSISETLLNPNLAKQTKPPKYGYLLDHYTIKKTEETMV